MTTEDITIEELVNWYCEEHNIELWKDIEGYEGLYQVSNTGKVKSLERKVKKWDGERTITERILKPHKRRNYLGVRLCKNGEEKDCSIQQLVAQAFVPNPHNYPQVNHIDEVKTSNNAANLEWCDAHFNCNWGTRNERMKKSLMNNTRESKQVIQTTLDGCVINVFPSANEAARQLGLSQGNISNCCRGLYKQAYGYVWKYKDEGLN